MRKKKIVEEISRQYFHNFVEGKKYLYGVRLETEDNYSAGEKRGP